MINLVYIYIKIYNDQKRAGSSQGLSKRVPAGSGRPGLLVFPEIIDLQCERPYHKGSAKYRSNQLQN